MKIRNKTRQTIIAEEAINALGIKDKTIGLLKYSEPRALVMKTRFGIHTFGMKYAIDVIILNNRKEVVKIKRKLKPGNILFWNPQYNTVIELPANVTQESKTRMGDVLEIIE